MPERLLSLFVHVRRGEGVRAILLTANVFVILVAYYLLEVVREPLILTGGTLGCRGRRSTAASTGQVILPALRGRAGLRVAGRARRPHATHPRGDGLAKRRRHAGHVVSGLVDKMPRVAADPLQLQQVVLNLLVNAVEAMDGVGDRPREITITPAAGEKDQAHVEVRDTGVGLDATTADRLFQSC